MSFSLALSSVSVLGLTSMRGIVIVGNVGGFFAIVSAIINANTHNCHASYNSTACRNCKCKIACCIKHDYRIVFAIRKHVARKQTTSRCRNISVRIYKSSRFGVIVAGLQVIQPRFGWILLCTQERLSPSRDLLFRAVPAEKANVTALYQVPASIAFVIPQRQNLSGVLLKPLGAWDYPSSRPFVPKRRCLLARWHSSPRKCYRFYL